jgi:hypothetical protein
MGFISQLVASGVGGAIGGSFVLWGVKVQSERQSEAALRAVMVEVTANKEAATEMNRSRTPTGDFVKGKPDPGWLKHSIWDSQLALVVHRFDEGTLTVVRYAYSLLESVPAMVSERRAPGDPLYSHSGWIDETLVKIKEAFDDADRALETLRQCQKRDADGVWYKTFASDVRSRFRLRI